VSRRHFKEDAHLRRRLPRARRGSHAWACNARARTTLHPTSSYLGKHYTRHLLRAVGVCTWFSEVILCISRFRASLVSDLEYFIDSFCVSMLLCCSGVHKYSNNENSKFKRQ
jgi:hypothetical protein